MAEVRVVELSKYFGNARAVDSLNLTVDEGKLFVLLGPSGCGKTTSLRCIAGLERPSYGEIYVGDRLVNDVPPRDRDMAMVFQRGALYPHYSNYDNIAYPLRLRKMPRAEINKKVREAAAMLEIEEILDRPPGMCSGGEQQRVALGRAMVREPQAFLMDEPLSSLDAILRVSMRVEIKRLQQRLGITTIYVTHDQVEAMSLADTIVVMAGGSLQQEGAPMDIYNKPANVFVGRFVGTPPMNFLTGEIVTEDGEAVFESAGVSVPIGSELASRVPESCPSGKCTLGVRPECVHVVAGGTGMTQGQVVVLEPLGSEVILNITIDRMMVKAKVDAKTPFRAGDMVGLVLDDFHLFDAESENAIR